VRISKVSHTLDGAGEPDGGGVKGEGSVKETRERECVCILLSLLTAERRRPGGVM